MKNKYELLNDVLSLLLNWYFNPISFLVILGGTYLLVTGLTESFERSKEENFIT